VVNHGFLDGVMIVEIALLALAVAVYFSHGLWLFFTQRRLTMLIEQGRAAMARVLTRSSVDVADVKILRSLPQRVQVEVFLEISLSLSGTGKERLRFVAREVSLLERARKLCESRRWTRRLRGARLLSRMDVTDPIVDKMLADPHPAVRAQAAEWAATHPSPAVVARMLEMLADPATQARFAVQDALLRMGPVVTEPLEKFLETRSGAPAASGLRIAESVAEARFRPAALRLSANDDALVRIEAARLLGAIGGAPSAERLIALLNDTDSKVRAAAAHGIGRMQYWEGASRLAESLCDKTWRVRREAALALRAIGAPGALFLRRALKGEDRFASDMAQQILDLPEAAAGG
jgi:hypothetical protein